MSKKTRPLQSSIPKGTPGFDIITLGHVEGHASALMRQLDVTEATLYINNTPCVSCDKLLTKMIPEGANLRVVWPNGEKLYQGLP